MLRAQIGQSVLFKTPTKLQHPYCNSFGASAIGKLDLVMGRRNASLFRDLEARPIFTLRIRIFVYLLVGTAVPPKPQPNTLRLIYSCVHSSMAVPWYEVMCERMVV
jgi:hypothetical protein